MSQNSFQLISVLLACMLSSQACAQAYGGFALAWAQANNQIGYFITTKASNEYEARSNSASLCSQWVSRSSSGPQIPCRVVLNGVGQGYVAVALSDGGIGYAANAAADVARQSALSACANGSSGSSVCKIMAVEVNY